MGSNARRLPDPSSDPKSPKKIMYGALLGAQSLRPGLHNCLDFCPVGICSSSFDLFSPDVALFDLYGVIAVLHSLVHCSYSNCFISGIAVSGSPKILPAASTMRATKSENGSIGPCRILCLASFSNNLYIALPNLSSRLAGPAEALLAGLMTMQEETAKDNNHHQKENQGKHKRRNCSIQHTRENLLTSPLRVLSSESSSTPHPVSEDSQVSAPAVVNSSASEEE
ncbi:hypothetical protein STEG23_006039 [Scotinomys teguina]